MPKPLKGFISYSHENKSEKDRLIKFLDVMEQRNELKTWHDGDIVAGDAARQEDILKEIANSDLLLFLVSADSLASEGCKSELEEASKRDITVISIILEHCDWLHHQLSGFEVLPDKGKPLTKWEDESEGWQNVVDGIRKAVEKIKTQANSSSETSGKELSAELAFQRGNVQMLLGQLDIATKAYSDAVKFTPRHADAIKAYSDAIELNPRHVHAYNNRGLAYEEIGNFERAIEDYNVVYIEKGEYGLAIQDLSKAMELDPKDAKVYENRGGTYVFLGEIDKAIEDYNTAIQLNPKNADIYYNRGVIHGKKVRLIVLLKTITWR